MGNRQLTLRIFPTDEFYAPQEIETRGPDVPATVCEAWVCRRGRYQQMMQHLFIDDHEIEQIDNLMRKLHHPQKCEHHAVNQPESHWENYMIRMWGAPPLDTTAGLYKMIYLGTAAKDITTEGGGIMELDATGEPGTSGHFCCYAASDDVVMFTRQ